LSVEEIEAHLSDRFRLLTGGSRAALPRQQTLRALVDWSYDLLSDAERVLLRRLSVCAGGWTLEAAEAIGAGAEGKDEVMDLLVRLVDKSLIAVDEHDGVSRYRFLETIRQYGVEKLGESRRLSRLGIDTVTFISVSPRRRRSTWNAPSRPSG
jgi:predicted ATPase